MFLVLGVISAGHHHRLVVADEAVDCMVCRAADPVRIVLPDVVVPDVVITSVIAPTLTEPVVLQPFPRCSPRAPPVAA
ncbi:MAG: hypothetical protein ACJ74H_16335 [Thermoanaerobaculia bacterium]